MRLFDTLRSQLQYKIIVPFLLLTLLVALVGAAVAFLFIAGTAQERLNNQLAQAARAASDGAARQERANLVFLREMAFAGANPQSGAPAVAAALANSDDRGLAKALDPFFRVAAQRPGVGLDRLIAFDASGRSMIDWERTTDRDGAEVLTSRAPRSLTSLWFVPRVLGRQSDAFGDKYAGLLDLGNGERYFFSVAPVLNGEEVVGGLVVASRIETLLQSLQDDSLAAIVGLYGAEDGAAIGSTLMPEGGLSQLNIRSELVASIRDLGLAEQQSIFDTLSVNQRAYQFAYVPLRIRDGVVGLLSVALASDYVTSQWTAARAPLVALTVLLMLAIIGLGVLVARQITRPLEELVGVAQAVAAGDLDRRSHVAVHDEIGVLATSFNDMTAHLLDLYRAVRAESSQRAAIVESITDGVIVCDIDGGVLILNRAARTMLGLEDQERGPQSIDDVPLTPLSDGSLSFGAERAPHLYTLNGRIVRVTSAAVDDHGMRLGDVYVLQDLTSEVAVDRAKTNFIATISHELRTPLTVLSGSSDLLSRGLTGSLNEEQQILVESMRRHTLTMTTLLNNVIMLAGLDSGTVSIDVQPVDVGRLIEDALWSYEKEVAMKGLELRVEIAPELPPALADPQQLRNALSQLLDNARRYTDAGAITIRALPQGEQIGVEISDTGRGIEPQLASQLFTRFTRGVDGISSAERGIGLGLAIAKELLDRQGGAIRLERSSDEGTTFTITLARAHADQHYNDAELASAA